MLRCSNFLVLPLLFEPNEPPSIRNLTSLVQFSSDSFGLPENGQRCQATDTRTLSLRRTDLSHELYLSIKSST
jgi:hypothetical protein